MVNGTVGRRERGVQIPTGWKDLYEYTYTRRLSLQVKGKMLLISVGWPAVCQMLHKRKKTKKQHNNKNTIKSPTTTTTYGDVTHKTTVLLMPKV